jgi:predicted dehydrogenase
VHLVEASFALTFSPPSAPRRPSQVAPLRIAVVGTGGWGEQHARFFVDRPDPILCAVVGRDPGRTAARAQAYDTTAYTDVDVMLDVERPGLAEADSLLAEAAAGSLLFGIDLNHRYVEPVQRLRRAIDAGELGDLVFATRRFGGEPNFGASLHVNLVGTQVHGLDSTSTCADRWLPSWRRCTTGRRPEPSRPSLSRSPAVPSARFSAATTRRTRTPGPITSRSPARAAASG